MRLLSGAHIDALRARGLAHFEFDGVAKQLDDIASFVDGILDSVRAIHASPKLTEEGKREEGSARVKAGLEAVRMQKDKKLAGLDANLASVRIEHLGKDSKGKFSDRQIDAMLARMREFDPLQNAIAYGTATVEEQQLMEVASASVGRLPTKLPNGGIRWQPLLEPETVTTAVTARAAATDPKGAELMGELMEIRGAFAVLYAAGEKAIRDSLGPFGYAEEAPSQPVRGRKK
jgi:hypothetical protein